MTTDKKAQEQINQLQLLEQNMQQAAAQKQQLQTQLFEVETAQKELKETSQAYKIIGSIMVASNKDALRQELNTKKEMLDLRISTLEKQEKNLKEKAKTIQEKVFSSLKKE